MENEKHRSGWIVAAICGGLVLLMLVGTVIALRDQMEASARAQAKEQTKEREKLSARIDMIQGALDSLGSEPKTDISKLDGIATTLSDSEAKIDILTARVEALEKQMDDFKAIPVPAPVAFAPVAPPPEPTVETRGELTTLALAVRSGQPFAKELAAWVKRHPNAESEIVALSEVATNGIISEAELSRSLLAALEAKPETKPVDDTSMIGKINTHLKGLVSIKKGAVDPYAKLRMDALHADAQTLEREVKRLSDADRAPLESWLKQAKQRSAALETLTKLNNQTSE